MSEASTETPAVETPAPASETPKSFSQEELDRIVSERVQRERSKVSDYADLKAKADRLAEIEESQKTEQQRLADAAAKSKQDADAARAEALRYKAAATHGVGADYFDLLGSGTEDEVSSRAERVGGFLKVQAENEQLKAEVAALRQGKPAPSSSRPIEALKPGATPTNAPSEDDLLLQQLGLLG